MQPIDDPEGLKGLVRWKGFTDTDDSFQRIDCVFEDVPQMSFRLLDRNETPSDLATEVCRALSV